MIRLNPEVEEWAKLQGRNAMWDRGASAAASLPFARLYGYAVLAGLNPYVTRIYSTSQHQRELQARYDAGDHMGLRVRPATTSKHIREDRYGPASDAMDMPCKNAAEDRQCAIIARDLGIRTGETFKVSDTGHYDV